MSELATIASRPRDAGVEFVEDEPLEGYERIYAYDPFGNRIELMQPN